MKVSIYIIFFFQFLPLHFFGQNNYQELKEMYFDKDTLYVYYNGGELQKSEIVSVGSKLLGPYYYEKVFFFKKNVFYDEDFIRFIKSKYLDFSLKIPDLKLIDTTWINKNQDKIVYPELFERFNVWELYQLLTPRVVYLIEEENFFGAKVYAREVRIYSNYSPPE
ncbi:hypothetical protein GGR32_000856 [Mesonia hippocampi]|uniref:Uncharacterized protein n=1 Tax=Mesonia hippocampi TaxID=1628250 RepID=A0A840ET34_9FLAO|nr:hypothetical protein [Mesonia hippocampi]MBB4118576.1 hypothetical protein [Mesonia hippocampi]